MVSVYSSCLNGNNARGVLILISVEDGFCDQNKQSKIKIKMGLNPYFCGRWFLWRYKTEKESLRWSVLILISVEDGFCVNREMGTRLL